MEFNQELESLSSQGCNIGFLFQLLVYASMFAEELTEVRGKRKDWQCSGGKEQASNCIGGHYL